MREQMAQRDDRHLAVRQRRAKIRQIARDRIGKRDLAQLDHAQRGRGDQRLGQRGKTKHRILAHRNAALAVRKARRAAIGDLAVLHHQHDAADDALIGERGVDRAVDCGGVFCLASMRISRTDYGRGARGLASPFAALNAYDADMRWRNS